MPGDGVLEHTVVGEQCVAAIGETLDRRTHPGTQAAVPGGCFPGTVQCPARLHPPRQDTVAIADRSCPAGDEFV